MQSGLMRSSGSIVEAYFKVIDTMKHCRVAVCSNVLSGLGSRSLFCEKSTVSVSHGRKHGQHQYIVPPTSGQGLNVFYGRENSCALGQSSLVFQSASVGPDGPSSPTPAGWTHSKIRQTLRRPRPHVGFMGRAPNLFHDLASHGFLK